MSTVKKLNSSILSETLYFLINNRNSTWKECRLNYLLTIWRKGGRLGNKMSDYATLIGWARRLKLKPFIVPSMKEELEKIFW